LQRLRQRKFVHCGRFGVLRTLSPAVRCSPCTDLVLGAADRICFSF
jgi:hypothetical protein